LERYALGEEGTVRKWEEGVFEIGGRLAGEQTFFDRDDGGEVLAAPKGEAERGAEEMSGEFRWVQEKFESGSEEEFAEVRLDRAGDVGGMLGAGIGKFATVSKDDVLMFEVRGFGACGKGVSELKGFGIRIVAYRRG